MTALHTTTPRVFCIGKNYAAHVAELAHLGYSPDGECVVFMKPATSLCPPHRPVRLPAGVGAVHHEAELVVRLGRGGHAITEADAGGRVDAIALGLDLTLRDLQTGLKQKGQPWELAKAFDDSAPLGPWTPWTPGQGDLQDIRFSLAVNGTVRQQGHTASMLFTVARQIAILSRTWELLPGDVIYTGTPEGVGPLLPGDTARLEGSHGLATTDWSFVARA